MTGETAEPADHGPRIPVIGLVGGIGAGKSAVARLLADAGCVVSDADADARAALDDPEIRRRLRDRFGDAVFTDDGAVDRGRLADVVFADPAARCALEEITHPWIHRRRRSVFDRARSEARAGARPAIAAFVIDAPLLVEAGLDAECDAVIFVDAPRDIRLDRVRRTRGWDERELARREGSQIPLDEKRSRADHVLRNDGDLSTLNRQVLAVLAVLQGIQATGTPGSDPGR